MNFTFTKVDPSCYNVLPIRWDECPEQSLSTIGINFSALDAETCNLGFSAENVWNPLYTEFSTNSALWNSVFTTVNSFSACWQSTYNTVQSMSAAWISPITIIYPNIFAPATYSKVAVTAWIAANFPVSQGGCVNYLNGQVMKVFSTEYAQSQQNRTGRCKRNYQPGIITYIGNNKKKVQCGCSCVPKPVTCKDKYINRVYGIELVVVNGGWVYLRDIY